MIQRVIVTSPTFNLGPPTFDQLPSGRGKDSGNFDRPICRRIVPAVMDGKVSGERGISALRLDHTIARHSELIYNSAHILPGWRTLFTAAWARPIQGGGTYTCGRSLETLRESPRKFWYRSRGWRGLDNDRVHTFTFRGAPRYQNSTYMACMNPPPWPSES